MDKIINKFNEILYQEIDKKSKTITNEEIENMIYEYITFSEDVDIDRVERGDRHIIVNYTRKNKVYVLPTIWI